MKRGHVTGSKRERKGTSDWYRQIEEENLRAVETAQEQKTASAQRGQGSEHTA